MNSNEGEELIIAPTSLLDALRPRPYGTENDGFASEEAVRLDEKVFFYTNDADLQLPDDELVVMNIIFSWEHWQIRGYYHNMKSNQP